jgi:hypothetical protein
MFVDIKTFIFYNCLSWFSSRFFTRSGERSPDAKFPALIDSVGSGIAPSPQQGNNGVKNREEKGSRDLLPDAGRSRHGTDGVSSMNRREWSNAEI